MANSPQEEGGEAQAKRKLSFVVFDPEVVQDLRNRKPTDPLHTLTTAISENHDYVDYMDWLDENYERQDGFIRGIKDKKGIVYVILVEDEGNQRKIIAQCKLVPPGVETVTAGIAENLFQKSAQQLIDPDIAGQFFTIFSENRHEDEEHITKTNGVYGINSSKLRGVELIQFFVSSMKEEDKSLAGYFFLLLCYLMATFPEDKIKDLNMPIFPKGPQTPDRAQAVEAGKGHIKTLFKTKLIYTTTWGDGIPPLFIKFLNEALRRCEAFLADGLQAYVDQTIEAENPYKEKAPHNEYYQLTLDILDSDGSLRAEDLSLKWKKHTLKLWDAIYQEWRSHMKQEVENGKNFGEAHAAFISSFSEQLNGFSAVAEAGGIVIPIGPPILEHNPKSPKRLSTIRAAVLPPFNMEIPNFFEHPFESYNSGALTWKDIYRRIKEGFGIDLSEVSVLNASGGDLLPKNYLQEFHKARMAEAESIEKYLLEYAPVDENGQGSLHRVPLPSNYFYQYYHLLEKVKHMQVPNGNNPSGHDEGR
jgi:hypothetical protein